MTSSPAQTPHADMANAVRALAMDAVERARSGHPGMPMGMADAATVLFSQALSYDPSHPAWPNRDRFVLSAGHGSMLLYALLYLTGYPDMTLDDLRRFRQLGSKTAGHPEYGCAAGIETTTGPLGQGLANAVGMALAERIMAARFGDDLVDHRTYAIVGDGCLMEGVSHEAVSLAGHLGLHKLTVLFDDNGISIDGPTALTESGDVIARFQAAGWDAWRVDGHDPQAVAESLARARRADRPCLIACRTVIGFGAPQKAGTAACHGAPLGEAEVAAARAKLNWPHAPFVIPDPILAAWRSIGQRGRAAREAWEQRLRQRDDAFQAAFARACAGEPPQDWQAPLQRLKRDLAGTALATRQASGKALEALIPHIPELLGGSADLTGSTNTRPADAASVTAESYGGRYLYYGVREHGMAAIMNGLALHGGVIPYGSTFLVFTDYCRPAMRLAALMGLRVIYVLTHDSIGLGEDGPTHQPVEHLATLRALPGLQVFRPCDAVETVECWALAIESAHAPSALALTRQETPPLRTAHRDDNLCARGGYVLREATGGPRQATLIASGSEVAIAIEAQARLQAEGLRAAVVSLPCMERFEAQDDAYRQRTLGDVPRVAIEAGLRQGWDRHLGAHGVFIGMNGFGASAPAADLYAHFGITAAAAAAAAKRLIQGSVTEAKV